MTCTKCAGSGKLTIAAQGHSMILTCGRCAGSGTVPLFYAGIGSRETPGPILLEMQSIAMQLALRGFALRSGKAEGADAAFEKGCTVVGGRKVLRTHTDWAPAIAHAMHYHPAWDRCSDIAKALHARNSLVMMGDDLDLSVSFVVCWTPDGNVTGGTGQALRIAHAESIPVFNLAVVTQAALWAWLDNGQVV